MRVSAGNSFHNKEKLLTPRQATRPSVAYVTLMSGKPKKGPREKDLTSRYLSGALDEDRLDSLQAFKPSNKERAQSKILRTSQLRQEESAIDTSTLPVGRVIQVFSLYCEVEFEGSAYLCVVRKTLQKISKTQLVVGDFVRFRIGERECAAELQARLPVENQQLPQGVVEEVLPRKTVLTRADSFKGIVQHPIVANAQQMLIVISAKNPRPKWGLVDRMLVAASAGGLEPVLCLNKIDLVEGAAEEESGPTARELDVDSADPVLVFDSYTSLGYRSLKTSAENQIGLDALREVLHGKDTVVAGHSGVGKSSLINAIQSALDLRVGEISRYTNKGIHTTTSARRYPLDFGGSIIDTPGVKMFGLWQVTRENLIDYFPDVANETAPPRRQDSYERILESLRE